MRRAGAAVAVSLALLCAGAGAADAAPTGTASGTGDLVVDGLSVPVEASFHYRRGGLGPQGDGTQIAGMVHAVNRIEGGTVLYYSVATDSDSTWLGAFEIPSSLSYNTNVTGDIHLYVPQAGVVLSPLHSVGEVDFAANSNDLGKGDGLLRVGWAVFPELPDDVTDVVVQMGFGTIVGQVEVGDGLLEPVADDAGPLLGEGWPKVASAAQIATADPTVSTWTLVERTADLEQVAVTEQSTQQVDTTLSSDVLFATDSADVSAAAMAVLQQVGADIAARGSGQVTVTGYTDSQASTQYNQRLSERRAQAVLAVLQPLAGSSVSFVAVGKGESDPVADNTTDAGRAANRRVTVSYQVVAQ